MRAPAGRREFLQRLFAGAALGAGGRLRASATQTQDAPGITALSPTLRLVSGAGGSVVVLNGSDGVLMVTGGAAAHSARLSADIADRPAAGASRSCSTPTARARRSATDRDFAASLAATAGRWYPV